MPLSSVWIPRRSSNGLFVQRKPVYPAWGPSRVFDKLRHVVYPTLNGVYSSLADSQWSLTNGYAYGVQTPYGLGLDVPSGWYWNDGKSLPINVGPITSTYVSVFSLYAASTAVSASKFASLFTVSTASKYNDSGTYAWWKNTAGEQAILVNPSISGGGAEFSITGVGNGLHCFVMQVSVGGGATGVRSFLDGQLVATTQAPTYAPQLSSLPSWYWGSIAQRDLNVGNLHLYVELFDDAMTDSALAALSLNPYRFFFVDEPSQRLRRSRFISLPASFQFSRPSADLLTGWTRVPASGTHVSAINETASNQTDYLSATSAGLVDSFTMQPIDQPLTGGVDINLDIDASARPVTVDLLNGATVVKSASVSTTGQTTISASAAELSGVSWPWTPTVRITSQ